MASPRLSGTRIDRSPSRALLAGLFAVILLCIVGGFYLFRHDPAANPESLVGSQTTHTPAPARHGGL